MLRAEDAARVAAALALVARARRSRAQSRPAPVERARLARLAARVGEVAGAGHPGRTVPVSLDRAEALDLAAELVELADRLHCSGHVVEAFALEGVEGRLLEALVGAGGLGGR